jgi:hypothetical protein
VKAEVRLPVPRSTGHPYWVGTQAGGQCRVVDPRLTLESVEAVGAERRRYAESRRELRVRRAAPPALGAVTMRLASAEDDRALDRLAQLDSGSRPAGPLLVAEVDGTLVAALPLAGGGPVTDPFRATTELVPLLELRADQLTGGIGRRGLLGRLLAHRRALPA